MLMGAPPMEAQQDCSIHILDLTKVVMARRRRGLTKERLVPSEAGRDVAYTNDRPMTFRTMGDDIAALLDYLKISKADLVGHSFGGASAIRTAIQHPHKVRRLVVISSPSARAGWYPEARNGMSQVGASMAENMMQTPTGKFSKQWPEPQRFRQFLDKFGKMMSEDYDWSADIVKLPMPVLLVLHVNDSISQKHTAEFFPLLAGGVKEPGGLKTQFSKCRLAVVPGYSHYNFITSPEVPQIIGTFLADPLTNTPAGAAAASQAAPAPKQTP